MNLRTLSILLALVSDISTLQLPDRQIHALRSYEDVVGSLVGRAIAPKVPSDPVPKSPEPDAGGTPEPGGSPEGAGSPSSSDGGNDSGSDGTTGGLGSGSSGTTGGLTDGTDQTNDNSNPLKLPQPEYNADGISDDSTPLEGSTTAADEAQFEIGTYEENSVALFGNFDDAQRVYHSKVTDFFIGQDPTFYSDLHPYTKATGSAQPFPDSRPSGQPLTYARTITSPTIETYSSVFDPAQPTAVCGAWTSLASYCSGTMLDCICYSGTFFVPEQWNSLAAGCAAYTVSNSCADPSNTDFWCGLAISAAAYSTLCPASGGASGTETAVRFAATWDVAALATTTSTSMAAGTIAGIVYGDPASTTTDVSYSTPTGTYYTPATEGAAPRVSAGAGVWLVVMLLCCLYHI